MYGLPANFDSSFFMGRKLEQICFSENTLSLHFDHEVSVIVESSYEYLVNNRRTAVEHLPETRSELMGMLGLIIASAHGSEDGTLRLHFEGGSQFASFDTSRRYESYHIRRGNTTIVV